jgi:predicted 2-oxoglutarate/Fe(II)-dependent dioxygenase YbiX
MYFSLGSPVQAELCMTGGHFKSHVDMPHSKDMFGSLMVCLPSEFTGGTLVTRHQGREVTFDWSASAATHWAAFFSDVEHEVLPVTSGHQITLTTTCPVNYAECQRDWSSSWIT